MIRTIKTLEQKTLTKRVKIKVLQIFIGTFARVPLVGKRGRKNAATMVYKTEKIPLENLPDSLQGLSLMYLTDPHIGGNIDTMVEEVSLGIHTQLKKTLPEKTLILHGGDFICGEDGELSTSEKDVFENASLLFRWLHKYPNFAVVGNHDDDDAAWGNMRKHLEEKNIHFLEEPKDMQTLHIGDAHVCVHGIHTLLDRLNTMSVEERNILLDSYIHLLAQTKTDFHIVLLHNPDWLEYLLQRLKVTKQSIQTPTMFLAWHTHGSSLDIPLLRRASLRVCKIKFKRYKGWYGPKGKYAQTWNWKLYVSTGMGNGPGFDFRLNAHPEVVLFTL